MFNTLLPVLSAEIERVFSLGAINAEAVHSGVRLTAYRL